MQMCTGVVQARAGRERRWAVPDSQDDDDGTRRASRELVSMRMYACTRTHGRHARRAHGIAGRHGGLPDTMGRRSGEV